MTAANGAAASGNLPAEPNSFIGRERDLTELVGMLGRVRALTLCGPGGMGKTRLALRLPVTLVPSFADGARSWWRGGVTSDNRVVVGPVAALGIRAEPGRPPGETLIEALRPRALILILDTCEHLVGPAPRSCSGCWPGARGCA